MLVHMTFKYFSRLTKCIMCCIVTVTILVFMTSFSNQRTKKVLATTALNEYEHNRGKFILLWTDPKASPFNYFGKGSSIFKAKSCKYTNCYVTGDRHELGGSSMFDVILFNGPQLPKMLELKDFPNVRSTGQKYVYANIESAQNYPMCTTAFNGFFNWTWTYRLDSDRNWGYFVVKNKTRHVVAPKLDVKWKDVNSMEDIDEKLKVKLKSKTKAAAWIASHCQTISRREHFVEIARKYLKNYNLGVDTYGACGTLQCPAFINERCLRLLEKEYYFYFAFENSFSVDYVTEKVLTALRHNTVPVVYGGANYTRFLPPGSYLDAYELGPERLASTINDLIKNPEAYYKYFRWQNHYSFHLRHESPETDDYCKFCEVINNHASMETTSIHYDFDAWWNSNNNDLCLGDKSFRNVLN